MFNRHEVHARVASGHAAGNTRSAGAAGRRGRLVRAACGCILVSAACSDQERSARDELSGFTTKDVSAGIIDNFNPPLYPRVVSIVYRAGATVYACSGVLIGRRAVVTSLRCRAPLGAEVRFGYDASAPIAVRTVDSYVDHWGEELRVLRLSCNAPISPARWNEAFGQPGHALTTLVGFSGSPQGLVRQIGVTQISKISGGRFLTSNRGALMTPGDLGGECDVRGLNFAGVMLYNYIDQGSWKTVCIRTDLQDPFLTRYTSIKDSWIKSRSCSTVQSSSFPLTASEEPADLGEGFGGFYGDSGETEGGTGVGGATNDPGYEPEGGLGGDLGLGGDEGIGGEDDQWATPVSKSCAGFQPGDACAETAPGQTSEFELFPDGCGCLVRSSEDEGEPSGSGGSSG